MQLHLDEISRMVAKSAHAVLLLDRAGWHTTDTLTIPRDMTLNAELAALARSGAEPRRKHLAISSRQLAFKPGF